MTFLQKITLLGLLFFASCDSSLDFILLEEPPKLVVWGYLYPSEVVKVNVSKTAAIGDTSNRLVNDATVILFENNQIVDTLTAIGNGNYVSSKGLKPVESRSYFIEIHKEGFDILRSISSIVPPAPRIDSVSLSFIPMQLGNSAHEPYGRIFVAYGDEDNVTGYTGLKITLFKETGEPSSNFSIGISSFSSCKAWYMDDIFYRKNCFSPNTILEVHSLNNKPTSPDSCRVKLCYTTAEAVSFHSSLASLYDVQTGFEDSTVPNLFYEPTFLPSVIENGYGYFGVCNCVDSTFHF